MVTATAIQSTKQPREIFRFEFDGGRIAHLNVVGETATAMLGGTADTLPVPVRLVQQSGLWRIDAIGTPEELQQQVRMSLQHQNGASPRAAVDTFREAVADGRFATALDCMTKDTRHEWLGEMLVTTATNHGYEHHIAGRWFRSVVDSPDPAAFEMLAVLMRHQPEFVDALPGYLAEPELAHGLSFDASAAERRAACIELARRVNNPDELLVMLLGLRAQAEIPNEFEGSLLEGRDIDHADWTFSSDLPGSFSPSTVHVGFVEIDGLWKLNTIIDPALKPWPLPVEEVTVPNETAPLDNGGDALN